VRGKLKKTLITDTYGESHVWDRRTPGTPLNGYRAFVTNQVKSNLVKNSSGAVCSAIFFGNWSDLIIGMWGASGLGVDYRNATNNGTSQMVTNYQSLQLVVPLTYKTGGFSIGLAPVLNYGALDTQWSFFGNPAQTAGAGASQDLSWGANLGLGYQTGGLTLGAIYKSSIEMEYEGQPALDADNVLPGFGITDATNWRLDVPAEYGVGGSYAFGKHTIAMDVKIIEYGDTKGWQDFGWNDQNVIAIGYQYNTAKWALRAGYNYGKAPIENLVETLGATPGTPDFRNTGSNYFNAVGFPASVEQHITFGGSYKFTQNMALDLAFTYAPEEEIQYNITNMTGGDPVTTTHSQTALTAGLHFSF